MRDRIGFWWIPVGSFALAILLSLAGSPTRLTGAVGPLADTSHKPGKSPHDPTKFSLQVTRIVDGNPVTKEEGKEPGFLGALQATAAQKDVQKFVGVRELADSDLLVSVHAKASDAKVDTESKVRSTRAVLRWSPIDPDHGTPECHKVKPNLNFHVILDWHFRRLKAGEFSEGTIIFGGTGGELRSENAFFADMCKDVPEVRTKIKLMTLRMDFKQEKDGPAEVQVTGGSTYFVNGEPNPVASGDRVPKEAQPNGQNGQSDAKAWFQPLTQGPRLEFRRETDLAAGHRVENVVASAVKNVTVTGTINFMKKKFILEDEVGGENQF